MPSEDLHLGGEGVERRCVCVSVFTAVQSQLKFEFQRNNGSCFSIGMLQVLQILFL